MPETPQRPVVGYTVSTAWTDTETVIDDNGTITHRRPGHPDLTNPTPDELAVDGYEAQPVHGEPARCVTAD